MPLIFDLGYLNYQIHVYTYDQINDKLTLIIN